MALTKQELGQLAFSRLIAVFHVFVRPRPFACKSRLHANIFACGNACNIAQKNWNYLTLGTRDARKTRARNRQYPDFRVRPLVRHTIATASPISLPIANLAFGNSDYSLELARLVASTHALNHATALQPRDEDRVMRPFKQVSRLADAMRF